MEVGLIAQVLANSLSLSSAYAMVAVGLTLVFGVLRIFNFAHGELLMAGAFVIWFLFGENDVPFVISAVVAMLFVGVLALGIERALFRLVREIPFNGYIISLGLMYSLQVAALAIFGSLEKTVPSFIPGAVKVFGTFLSIQRLVIMAIAVSVMASVWILLERTRLGRAIRAAVQDSQAASLQGISLDSRMSPLVMFVGGALAGLAGALLSQTLPITPYLGEVVVQKAFVIVIVGGMGSIGGTMIASCMFGLLDSIVSTLINARITCLVDIIVMLIVIMFRPKGFLGHE